MSYTTTVRWSEEQWLVLKGAAQVAGVSPGKLVKRLALEACRDVRPAAREPIPGQTAIVVPAAEGSEANGSGFPGVLGASAAGRAASRASQRPAPLAARQAALNRAKGLSS